MPKQSLLAMKVAFGARAQYATILALSLLMVTQIIGVAIFSGTSRASSTAVFVRSLPSGAQPKTLYAGFRNYDSGIAEGPDNYLYAVTGGQAVYKLDQNGAYVSTITLSATIYAKDIAVSSSGDFYVLENNDSGSNQNSIKKFNSSGVYQGLVVGYNTFDTMRQIAINASDELYTIGSSTTKKYNTSGLQLGSWSVSGYRLAIDGNYVYSTYSGCFVRKLDTTTGLTTSFGGCGTADGQFNNTGGLDVDASGNVYVADMSSDRVQVFDASGAYQSSFGSNGMGDGQLMTSMLGYKNDVTVVGNGTVLVGDQFSNRIQVFNLAGTYVRELRDAYAAPAAMAIGSSGAMYVVDMHNSRIKKIDKGTGAVLAQWGSYGSGNGQFKFDTYAYMYKTGIAVDSQENVYVVDTDNHRIQKFTSAGVYVTQWGSDGLGVGQFDVVSDIAIDSSDQVYTLETGYQMYRVQRFDTNGQNAVSIGTTNQFNEPRALAVAANGTLYVADTTGSSPRIQVFTSAGSFDHNIAPGAGVGEFNSMTVDGRGNLLVGNYNFVTGINSIYRISTQGTFTAEALLGITTGTGDGQLWGVSGLTADKLGNFYVSDTQGRIQMFYNANSVPVNLVTRAASNIDLTAARLNLQTSDLLDKAGATYSFEYGTTTSYGSTAASSGIATAQSSTVSLTGGPTISHAGSNQYQDRSGNLYINPAGNLYKYSSSGQYLGQIGASGNFYGGNYANFAFDSQDNIYYTENGIGVQKYAANGTSLGSISGAPAGINRLATDNSDNVYVMTSASVYKYSSAGNLLNQFALPEAANMICGSGMVVDSAGYMYVLDAADCGVGGTPGGVMRKYTPDWQYVTEWVSPTTYNLYIDANDVIYVYGRTLFTTSGSTITSTGPLWTSGGGSYDALNKLMGVDVATGTVYAMSNYDTSVSTYASQGYANISGLTCGTTYHFRAKAVVGSDTVYGADQTFTTSACGVMSITTTSLPDGQVGTAYDQTIQTTSSQPHTYVISGSLPSGLSVSYDGHITGTPDTAGTYNFTVESEDTNGGTGIDTQDLQIVVAAFDQPIAITTTTLPDGISGQAYTTTIDSSNVHGTATYSIVSGSLPSGLSLASDGTISGTPDSGTSAYEEFTVQVNDDLGSDTQNLSLTINYYNPIQICDSTADMFIPINVAYDHTICTSGGFGNKIFTIIDGSLPPGMELDQVTGDIHGTPTQAGDYDATIQVEDLTGTAFQHYYYTVQNPPVIPTNTPIVTITSPASGTAFDYQHDTVTIAGTGPANQLITTFMDGQQLGTATVNGAGNWQYTVSNVFPGNHSFDAKWIPVGDLALIPSVDFDVSSGGAGITTSTLSLVDTASMETAKVVYLPETILVTASVINHAGTKGYVVGFDADIASAFYEIDIATGAITKATNLQFDQTIYGELFISDDDTTGYLLGASEQNVGYYSAVSVNLANLSMDGSSAVTIPFIDGVSGQTVARAMVSSAYYNGFIYNPESNGDNDPDNQTATAVNLSTGAATQIPLLSEPRWVGCDPRADVAGGKVYFISNNKLSVVDPATNTVIKTITVAGITDYHTCATGITIDPVHQRAFVYMTDDGNNGGGGLKAVDLVNETTTDVGDVPVDVFRAGVRSMIAEFYDRHHAELAQYLQDNPQPGIDINNLDPFYDMLTDSFVNGITQSDPGTKSFSAGDISSDGQRLYLATPYYGIYIAVDTASLQYVRAGGSFTFGYQVYFGGGNFVSHGVSPQASISFSVGQGPVAPPDDPPVVDPDPEDPPVITDVTPAPATTKPSKSNPITAPQTVVATQNSLFALAKRIPEPLAVGFPWLLLLLALILVGMQYYQVHTEEVSTKRMQTSVAKQQRLVEEQNNFVALSTHYLHTPLTIMEGEISLMVKAGTLTQQQATKLQATLTSLNAEAEAVLAQEEQNE